MNKYDIELNKKRSSDIFLVDSSKRNTTLYESPAKMKISLNKNYKQVIGLELIHAEISFNEYNINENNNIFKFKEGTNNTFTFIITPGVYTITDLLDTIMTEMNALSAYTYSYSINPITKKVSISKVGGPEWYIIAQGSEVSEPSGHVYYNYINNIVVSLLGFKAENYLSTTNIITASYPYDLVGIKYLNLFINKDSLYKRIESNNDAASDAFCVIPYDSSNNYTYNRDTQDRDSRFTRMFTSPLNNLNSLSIEIRDNHGNLYDFNGKNYYLLFDIIYE